MADSRQFQIALARELCEKARRETLPRIRSRTLAAALKCRVEIDPTGEVVARLAVPHYWAVYYHDGRGPVRPRRGRFLVWFKNIEDDPRVQGGQNYPRRASQIKRLRLTPAEFKRLLDEGKLIVTDKAGPARGRPFFKPLRSFQGRAAPTVRRRFSEFVRRDLREAGLLRLSRTLRVSLG